MTIAPTNPPSGPDPKEVKSAFKAFKKRLKLTQLDADSKLGGSPLSNSGASRIVSIQPPYGFAPEVWDELVKQGKLKKAGSGTYELVER